MEMKTKAKTEKKILIIAIVLFVISALFLAATFLMRNAESDNSDESSDSGTYSFDSDGNLETSEKEENNSSKKEDSLTYSLDSDGLLTVSGEGKMKDYAYDSQAPWYNIREEIKKVVIANGITSIGDYAFYDCSSLTSIEIPNSVTSIGNFALVGCSSLTSVEISDSVTSIGVYAFRGCSSLISIEIPISVTSIGAAAFSCCDNLMKIVVSKDNPNYSSDEDGVLFNKEKTELIAYHGGLTGTLYVIPDSVMNIGESAFDGCSNLIRIEIPDSVTSIGNEAFWSCRGLTSIEIPSSVTSIGYAVFSYCDNLTKIVVSEDNPNYSVDEYGVLFNKEKTELIAYPGGLTGTSYVIPGSVMNIGESAFSGCGNLTRIEIPDSVTSIGDFAFSSCRNLTRIRIPDSVTRIAPYAFRGCSSLTSIEMSNSITKIEKNTFDECVSLEDVYFHGSADEWDRISIGDGNEFLKYATVHFIYDDFGNVSDKAD